MNGTIHDEIKNLVSRIKAMGEVEFGYLFKSFNDDEAFLESFLTILITVEDRAVITAILSHAMENGHRISKLEKTIETYEEALKVLGKEVSA